MGPAVAAAHVSFCFERVDRFDAARDIAGEQADRAGRGDCEQMAVADAAFSDAIAQIVRQAADERRIEIGLRVEAGKCTFLFGQGDRGRIGRVANRLERCCCRFAGDFAVIGVTEHDERISKARHAQSDTPRAAGLFRLCREREMRDIDDVVEKAYAGGDQFPQGLSVEPGSR